MGKRKKGSTEVKQPTQATNEHLHSTSPAPQCTRAPDDGSPLEAPEASLSAPTSVTPKAMDVGLQPVASENSSPKDPSELQCLNVNLCSELKTESSIKSNTNEASVNNHKIDPMSAAATVTPLAESVVASALSISPLPQTTELMTQTVTPSSSTSCSKVEVKSSAVTLTMTATKPVETVTVASGSQQISKSGDATSPMVPLPSKSPATNVIPSPSTQTEITKPTVTSSSKSSDIAIASTTSSSKTEDTSTLSPSMMKKSTAPPSKEVGIISPTIISSKPVDTTPLGQPTSKPSVPLKATIPFPEQADSLITLSTKRTESQEIVTSPTTKEEITQTPQICSIPAVPTKSATHPPKQVENIVMPLTKPIDSATPATLPTSKAESIPLSSPLLTERAMAIKLDKQSPKQKETVMPTKSTVSSTTASVSNTEASAPTMPSSPKAELSTKPVTEPSRQGEKIIMPANPTEPAASVTSPISKSGNSVPNTPPSLKPAEPTNPTSLPSKLAETTITSGKLVESSVTSKPPTPKVELSASTVSSSKQELSTKPVITPSKPTKPDDIAAPVAPPTLKTEASTPIVSPLKPAVPAKPSLTLTKQAEITIKTAKQAEFAAPVTPPTSKIEVTNPYEPISKQEVPTISLSKQAESTITQPTQTVQSTVPSLLPTSETEISDSNVLSTTKPSLPTKSDTQPPKQTETSITSSTKSIEPHDIPLTSKPEILTPNPLSSSKTEEPTKAAMQPSTQAEVTAAPLAKLIESPATPPTSKTESSTPHPPSSSKPIVPAKPAISPSKQAKTTVSQSSKSSDIAAPTISPTPKADATKSIPPPSSKPTTTTKPTKSSSKPEGKSAIPVPLIKQTPRFETAVLASKSDEANEPSIHPPSKPTVMAQPVEGTPLPATSEKPPDIPIPAKVDEAAATDKLPSKTAEKSSPAIPFSKMTKPGEETATTVAPDVAVKTAEDIKTHVPFLPKSTNSTDGTMKTPSLESQATTASPHLCPKKSKSTHKSVNPAEKLGGNVSADLEEAISSEAGILHDKSKKLNKMSKEKNPKQKAANDSILKEIDATAHEKSEPSNGKNKSGTKKATNASTKKQQTSKGNTVTDSTSILDVVQEVIESIGKEKNESTDAISLKDISITSSKAKESDVPNQDKSQSLDENEEENAETKKSKKSRKKKKSKSTEQSGETIENEIKDKGITQTKTPKGGKKGEGLKAKSKINAQVTKEANKTIASEVNKDIQNISSAENKVINIQGTENEKGAGDNQKSMQPDTKKDSNKKSKKKKSKTKIGVLGTTEIKAQNDAETSEIINVESSPSEATKISETTESDFQQKKKRKRSRNKGKKTMQDENASEGGIKDGVSVDVLSNCHLNNTSEKNPVPVPKMSEENEVKAREQTQPNKKVSSTLSEEQLSHLTRTAVHLSKSVEESERPGLTFTPDLIGCLLAPKPTDITAMPDEEEEIEYRLVQRQIFLSYVCHVCKSLDISNCSLKTCNSCKLISYCSKKHQKEHWFVHKYLCKAICSICKSDGMENLFQKAKGLSPDEYRYYRSHYVNRCANELGRELELWEKEMIYYPQLCQTCYEYDVKKLTTCQNCRHVSYCQPSHLKSDHNVWCKDFQIYRDIILNQFHNGMIEPFIPENVFQDYSTLNSDMKTFILNTLIVDKSLSPNSLTYITLTDVATCPLTVLFSLQKSGFQRSVSNTLIIHLVGAEMHFEIDHIKKWELLLLHLLPDFQSLQIVFVGPELTTDVVMKTLGQNKMCKECQAAERNVSYIFWPGLYQEFFKSEKYQKPDLICAFNAGLYRLSDYAGKDTWAGGIEAMLTEPGIPVTITEYTDQELPFDIQRIGSTVGSLEVILSPSRNPYSSSKPSLNFLSEEKVPVIFKNYNMAIVRKGKN